MSVVRFKNEECYHDSGHLRGLIIEEDDINNPLIKIPGHRRSWLRADGPMDKGIRLRYVWAFTKKGLPRKSIKWIQIAQEDIPQLIEELQKHL